MKFFDPHPGLLGCPVRLPEAVRLVANELDGTETTIEDAVAKIQAACPDGTVEAHEDAGMIVLKRVEPYQGKDCEHHWRVIRFNP